MSKSVVKRRELFFFEHPRLIFITVVVGSRCLFVGLLACHDQFLIPIQDVLRLSVGHALAGVQKDRAGTQRAHSARVVGNKKDGYAAFLHLFQTSHATMLEDCIANGERFIDDQNVRSRGDRDRKGEAHIHATRVSLDWLVKERSDLGKAFNLG